MLRRDWRRRGAARAASGAQASRVVAGDDQQASGGLGPDARLSEQPRRRLLDELEDVGIELGDLVVEVAMAAGEAAHRLPGGGKRGDRVSAMPARAALDESLDGQIAQVVAEILRSGEQEVAQLQDRLRAGLDGAGARDPEAVRSSVCEAVVLVW